MKLSNGTKAVIPETSGDLKKNGCFYLNYWEYLLFRNGISYGSLANVVCRSLLV